MQGPGVWVSTERGATESPIGNFSYSIVSRFFSGYVINLWTMKHGHPEQDPDTDSVRPVIIWKNE